MNEFYAYIIENILRFYKDPFSTDLYNEALYGTIGFHNNFFSINF
jgi:hypothetical protein